jgi:LCP family protein required for cell wall assembly
VTTPLASTQPRRRRRWSRVLKWTAITLAGVLVIVGGGGYLLYRHYVGQITTAPIIVSPGSDIQAPKIVANAENFLLMGSDSRAGANGVGTGGSSISGARSDTTILLHLSAGDGKATMVSIPRDSYVQIPACVIGPNGQKSQPTVGKFNEAFSIGEQAGPKYAPSCAIATVEKLTHIHIDHYAVINFVGFEHVVEALGGVRMCVAKPLDDPIVDIDGQYHGSGLHLPAGPSVEIDGAQALALMRARYALDGGGDLPRIQRQQEFIGAVIRKAFSTGLLLNPIKLAHVINAGTKSLQTDGFGLREMIKLAKAIHGVGPKGIQILTVPLANPLPPGVPTADVAWDPTKSAELWNAIRHDKPIPGSAKAARATSPPLSIPPSDISVIVKNGTTRGHLARKVAQALEAQGFHVISTGPAATTTVTSTTVQYGTNKLQSSQTVVASIPGSVGQADTNAADANTITVTIGSNYTTVNPVKISATPSESSINPTSASNEGCLS